MLCLKGSPGRRCLFISYTGLLWIVLQASVSKGKDKDFVAYSFWTLLKRLFKSTTTQKKVVPGLEFEDG